MKKIHFDQETTISYLKNAVFLSKKLFLVTGDAPFFTMTVQDLFIASFCYLQTVLYSNEQENILKHLNERLSNDAKKFLTDLDNFYSMNPENPAGYYYYQAKSQSFEKQKHAYIIEIISVVQNYFSSQG